MRRVPRTERIPSIVGRYLDGPNIWQLHELALSAQTVSAP
jgi:hypothetical protein